MYPMRVCFGDPRTSLFTCKVGCGQSHFIIGVGTGVSHPHVTRMLYCTLLWFWLFVPVESMLQLPISLVLCNVWWSGGWTCLHWDIHLFINALALLSTHVGACSNFFLLDSSITAESHSWTRWSFVLYASCCYCLIDHYAQFLLTKALHIRQLMLMPVSFI